MSCKVERYVPLWTRLVRVLSEQLSTARAHRVWMTLVSARPFDSGPEDRHFLIRITVIMKEVLHLSRSLAW